MHDPLPFDSTGIRYVARRVARISKDRSGIESCVSIVHFPRWLTENRDDSIKISFDFHSILLFFSPKNIYHSLFLFEHLKITPWIIQKLSLFHQIPINIASMQNKRRREKDGWSLNVGRATFQNPISSRGGMRKEITHLINLLSLSVNANVSRYFANRRAYGAAERIFDTLPFESSH